MRLVTIQASAFKSIFEVLKDILNDVNLIFDKDGIHLFTLDNARSSLVQMHLEASKFETYEWTEYIECGINFSNTFKLLKCISSSDILEIQVNNKEIINIMVFSENKKSKTNFSLKLLDINETKMTKNLEIKNTVTTILPSIDFQRLCRDMSNIGTTMNIHRKDSQIKFSVNGDFANQETVIETDHTDLDIEGSYPFKYLSIFTKATAMCSNVFIIQEKENRFLVLKYDVANLGEINFYIASKIKDEDL